MQDFDTDWDVSVRLRRNSWLLHARAVEIRMRALADAIRAKYNFDPNQPRVPAGSGRESGRWTDGGGGGGSGDSGGAINGDTKVAQNVSRGRGGGGQYRLRSGRLVETTPTEEARLVAMEAEASRAIRQVQEVDPNWKPSPSVSSDTIQGDIARAEMDLREAQERLFELARQEPLDLIDAYRRQQGLDLFGEEAWSRIRHTIATGNVGGKPFVGMNSDAPTYTETDRTTAERFRGQLIQKYPDVLSTDNIGQIPNDSVFHAEVTVLLKAARANGGTLKGQTIEVHVDRAMCRSCEKVLPYVGLELGNPTVTFVDPKGVRKTIRDGILTKEGD